MIQLARPTHRGRFATALATVAAGLALWPSVTGAASGPRFSPAANDVTEAELVAILEDAAEAEGLADADIVCDGALAGTPGATQRCSLSDDGQRTGVVFELPEGGGTPEWTPFIFADDVAHAATPTLAEAGIRGTEVSCADDLVGDVGTVIICSIDDRDSVIVEVETTAVDGFVVDMHAATHPNDRMDGEPGYTQEELERAVLDGYAAAFGEAQNRWTCAGGLDAVRGSSQDCTYRNGDEVGHLRITVDEMDGDYVVLGEVPFVTADELAAALEPDVAAEGLDGNVTCPEEVVGTVDTEIECLVGSGPAATPIRIRVTSVDLLRVGFDWSVGVES